MWDNGSGVGVLLEIARLWQQTNYQPSRTILFAVWGSEELGQVGSQFFIKHPTIALSNTIAVYHLEGVGAGSGYYLQAQGNPIRESILRFTLDTTATQVKGHLDLVNSNRLSDQQSFRQAHIPAILLYWKGAETRNLPTDFAQEIDPNKLSTTGQILTLAAMMLAE